MKPQFLFFVLALLVFGVAPAWADTAPAPTKIDSSGETRLDGAIQYIEDTAGQLQLNDVMQADMRWQHSDQRTFNHGYNNSAWWLKVAIANPRDVEITQLFEVGYALLDHVDVYITANGQLRATFTMGDKLPFYTRPITHRFFALPVQFEPHQTLTLYLRISSAGAIQAPLTLWSYEHFNASTNSSSVLQGIYYGGMLLIALYNLLLYVVLRERTYLYYVGFVVCVPLMMAAVSGQSFRYLWPDATHWNDTAVVVLMSLSKIFGALFVVRFLDIATLSRPLYLFISAMVLMCIANGLLSFFLPYHVSVQVAVVLALAMPTTAFGAGVYALMRKQPSARLYLLAWFALLFGVMVLAANKIGLLPTNLFTEYAGQVGSLLEAVLLSFALAERINLERRLRYEAQSETLSATRRVNEELEERVKQRTFELEQLNLQLQQLSDTDQLTQLKNRRYLQQRLSEEWTRAVRYQHSLAVVMIDIDHFKSINDTHGHPVGDACLQQVAGLIGKGLRWPTDLVARYGGEEFCMLLPQTGVEGAFSVVERVRTLIEETLIETDQTAFHVTISAGVCAAIPTRHKSVEDFVRDADTALYKSKQHGRNRVTLAG